MTRKRIRVDPRPPANPIARRRVMWAAIALAAWSALIAYRLLELQVLRRPALVEVARKQQERTVEVEAPRGRILDRSGRALAASIEVPSLYADPSIIENPAAAAAALAPLLGRGVGDLRSLLATDRSFVWLHRRVSPRTAREVRELGLHGVAAISESRRYYPGGRLAAHLLGMVGVDAVGLDGIEYLYEDRVRGRPGRMLSVRDARGSSLLMYLERPSSSGHDLHLTLDAVIQYHAEAELDRAMKETGSASGSIIVMEPTTGAILAMANRPSFNPNAYRHSSPESRRNRGVTDAYEPGSTFKVVTAAAALERDLVDVAEVIDCGRGSVVVAGHRIRDHKVFDRLTFADVVAESSNVGIIQVGSRLTPAEFHATITAFGFGSRTGVGLPGESPGLLRHPRDWSAISQASLSFGQEMSATPLQVLRAVATVANRGILPQPYVLKDREASTRRGTRVISESTATTLNLLLERVVARGTGSAARVPGYRAAGKTGTAQKADPSGGYGDDHVASFVGYVPSRDPKLSIVIVLDSPRCDRYEGGQIAAPVFARVALPSLRHLGIAPDDGVLELTPERTDVLRTGSAPPTAARSPVEGAAEGVVPDLAGASLREALSRLARAGLEARVQGSGWVVTQDPPPGEVLRGEAVVRLLLSPRMTTREAAVSRTGRRSHEGGRG